jgi:phage shock protein E
MSTVHLIARRVCRAQHTKDSLDTVKGNLANGKAILLDVREPREWDKGHLQEAKLVALSQLRRIPNDLAVLVHIQHVLPTDQIIYCYCGGGVRVLTASNILRKLGYDMRPLAPGFSDLKAAGLPESQAVRKAP